MMLNSVKAKVLEHLTREGKYCSYIQHHAQNFNKSVFVGIRMWRILFRFTHSQADV